MQRKQSASVSRAYSTKPEEAKIPKNARPRFQNNAFSKVGMNRFLLLYSLVAESIAHSAIFSNVTWSVKPFFFNSPTSQAIAHLAARIVAIDLDKVLLILNYLRRQSIKVGAIDVVLDLSVG